MHILLFILMIMLTAAHSFVSQRFVMTFGCRIKSGIMQYLLIFLPTLLLFTLMSFVNIPLLIFYPLCYILKALQIQFCQGDFTWKKIQLNVFGVCMFSFHLVVVSGIALVVNCGLGYAMSNGIYRMFSLLVLLICDTAVTNMIIRRHADFIILKEGCGGGDFAPFDKFLWFSIGYVFVESILCSFDLLKVYTPLFLMGCSILLLYLIYSFLKNMYEIMVSLEAESENTDLKNVIEMLHKSTEDLRQYVDYDTLTGIYSRKYIMDAMQKMINMDEMFSVVFIDLDHFKKINDQMGHLAGDHYLCRFAKEMGERLRKVDIFGRIGGDEFLVLMPGCEKLYAVQRLERIRGELTVQEDGKSQPFSFGITTFLRGHQITDGKILLKEADSEMYIDKHRYCGQKGI